MSRSRSRSSLAAVDQRLGERSASSGVDEQPGVADGLGQRAGGRGDDRRPARHRLEARQAEALVARRHRERARTGVEPRKVLLGDVPEPPQR